MESLQYLAPLTHCPPPSPLISYHVFFSSCIFILSFLPTYNWHLRFPNKRCQDCHHHEPLFAFFWLLQESVLTTFTYSAHFVSIPMSGMPCNLLLESSPIEISAVLGSLLKVAQQSIASQRSNVLSRKWSLASLNCCHLGL